MGQQSEDVMKGRCCAECTVYFVKAHGYPVVCRNCAPAYTAKERRDLGYQIAIHREA